MTWVSLSDAAGGVVSERSRQLPMSQARQVNVTRTHNIVAPPHVYVSLPHLSVCHPSHTTTATNMKKFMDFFEGKARDRRFKKAGPGVRLADVTSRDEERKAAATASSSLSSSAAAKPAPAPESMSAAARAAAARAERNATRGAPAKTAPLDAEVQRQLLAEQETVAAAAASAASKADPQEIVHTQDALEIHFICSICNESVSRFAAKEHGPVCLITHMSENPTLYSASIIRSSDAAEAARQVCIDTLKKFISNIINNPSEAKYRRIALSNAAVQSRVAGVDGGLLFLEAAGFQRKQEDAIEVLIMPESPDDVSRLTAALAALDSDPEPTYCLQRNMQVIKYSGGGATALERLSLPDSFFQMTLDELQAEQTRRTAAIEHAATLRTRAMREQERRGRVYAYTVLRVRWPDGVLLQGTFQAYEPLSALYEFVRDALANPDDDHAFVLQTHPTRTRLPDSDDALLKDVGLVPSGLVNISSGGEGGVVPQLAPEVLQELRLV
eukprot:m.127423 g.127423  ORF g.127423 m.127423 type:complete len:499 (+) comp16365_c2_seq1:2236-3732(+)